MKLGKQVGWRAFQKKESSKGTKILKSWKGKKKVESVEEFMSSLLLQHVKQGVVKKEARQFKWVHFIVCK